MPAFALARHFQTEGKVERRNRFNVAVDILTTYTKSLIVQSESAPRSSRWYSLQWNQNWPFTDRRGPDPAHPGSSTCAKNQELVRGHNADPACHQIMFSYPNNRRCSSNRSPPPTEGN